MIPRTPFNCLIMYEISGTVFYVCCGAWKLQLFVRILAILSRCAYSVSVFAGSREDDTTVTVIVRLCAVSGLAVSRGQDGGHVSDLRRTAEVDFGVFAA